MKTGLIFLLLSGVVLVSSSFSRRFHVVSQHLNWTEAQCHCRKHFTDLANIQDSGQHAKAKAAAVGLGWFWIGLLLTWRWSLGHQDVVPFTGFSNWGSNQPRTRKCVSISRDRKWIPKSCGTELPMVCYNAETDSHVLVQDAMTWFEAQTHCRNVYTDLSSIRDHQENMRVAAQLLTTDHTHSDATNKDGVTVSQISPSLAWIGLYKKSWMWSDGSSISYRRWGNEQTPVEGPGCIVMDTNGEGDWYKHHCRESWPFLCYTDVPTSEVKSVKIRLSRGSADLNDPAVQESILQQVKHRLELQGLGDVKLRWRLQPDGKVFHREEERAPPSGVCEEID